MSLKYFTINDRNKIKVLHKEGYSSRSIAKILCFYHSTISREINRIKGAYSALEADKGNKYKSSFKGRRTKANNSITKIILDKLNTKWSLKQIAFTVLHGKVVPKPYIIGSTPV